MSEWVKEELAGINLGDKRLNKRCEKILGKIGERPFESIPASFSGWPETIAAYRFFDNDLVSLDKILSPHKEATLQRMKNEEVVLLVQDTTALNYTGNKSANRLGNIGEDYARGMLLHPTIAVTPDRLNLGIISAKLWTREDKEGAEKRTDRYRPIEEKESIRWLESYEQALEASKRYPEKTIVNVGDRENDIYEIFAKAKEEDNIAKFLIRAAYDRNVLKNDRDKESLWASVKNTPELGVFKLEIPKSKKREKRTAKLSVHVKKVKLKPTFRRGKKLPEVEVTAVLLKEKNAPQGVKSIEWLLLTNYPVNGFEDAIMIADWYSCRWQIEIYFKVLKSGCNIEELQLETEDRLERSIGLYMIVAWRVMYLMMLGRECPALPANVVFEEKEWKIIYVSVNKKKPPQKTPTLWEVIKMIASLGGYLNRKKDGPPGPKTIWIGLRRLADIIIGYDVASLV